MWGQLGGAIGGMLLQYQGQREANETNMEIAEQATWANAEQAQKNRDWQQQMSNTAHQREMEDLVKAGINPLLTATQSGASTPSGGVGSAATTSVENTMQGASAAAREVAMIKTNLEKQKAETAAINASEKKTKQDTQLSKASTYKAAKEAELIDKNIPTAQGQSEIWKLLGNGIKKFGEAGASSAWTGSLNPKKLGVNEGTNTARDRHGFLKPSKYKDDSRPK